MIKYPRKTIYKSIREIRPGYFQARWTVDKKTYSISGNDLQKLFQDFRLLSRKKKSIVLFGDYYDYYIKTYKEGHVRDSSLKEYVFLSKKFDCFRNKNIRSITHKDIQEFVNANIGKLSPGRLRKCYSLLKGCFSQSLLDHMIIVNPCDMSVKLPSEPRSKMKAFTLLQQKELFLFLQQYQVYDYRFEYYGPLLLFLISTGCRLGEALALTKNDFNYNEKVIHINKQLDFDLEGGTRETKTYAGNRDIPFYDFLQNIINIQSQIRFGNSPYVFCSSKGKLLKRRNIQTGFDNLCKSYNSWEKKHAAELKRKPIIIEKICCDICRHTFASNMEEINIGLKSRSLILGHTDIRTTLNTYTNRNANLDVIGTNLGTYYDSLLQKSLYK